MFTKRQYSEIIRIYLAHICTHRIILIYRGIGRIKSHQIEVGKVTLIQAAMSSGHPLRKWWWWRHQTEIFSSILALCAVNSPVTGEFPSQRPVTRSFGVFFDLSLNKRLCKTIVKLVIWDAISLIMTSLWCWLNAFDATVSIRNSIHVLYSVNVGQTLHLLFWLLNIS